MEIQICKTCGSPLRRVDDYTWSCPYCLNIYSAQKVKTDSEELKALLDEYKIEQVSNLRRNLYDALKEKYTDSPEICRICSEIKKLLPGDFAANFFYTANHGTPAEICEAIRNTDAEENLEYIESIVIHILSSMRSEYALPLQNLVERGYKKSNLQKYEALSTKISSEVERVNAGIYETSLPREAFIAYSSKDMDKVEELVACLEANGIDCFVAARNLRHGRGAVQNYSAALCEAIDSCGAVIFVSSHNSRNTECDALRVELKYIKSKDILNSPPEYRQNYLKMPTKYKKPRVEYRIDNQTSQSFADKITNEFFSGLEYAYSPEEVLDRMYNIDEIFGAEPEEVIPAKKTAKFCAECGAENAETVKFCSECGKNAFVGSFEEYVLLLRKRLADEKQKAEDEKRRAEEEKRRAEEEKRKAEQAIRDAEARKAEEAAKAVNYPTAPQYPASGNKEYSIYLKSIGPKKLQVIKEIRDFTGYGLKEAKDLAESAPATIFRNLSAEKAERFKEILTSVGATAIINSDVNENPPKTYTAPGFTNLSTGTYKIRLDVTGPQKLKVIKIIREKFGFGLAESKNISESTPYIFSGTFGFVSAQGIKDDLEEAGAKVSLIMV